jgi:hypothetical protein
LAGIGNLAGMELSDSLMSLQSAPGSKMNVVMLAALIVPQTIPHSHFNALAVKLMTIAIGLHFSDQWADSVYFTALAMVCFRVMASVSFHEVTLCQNCVHVHPKCGSAI